MDTPENQPTPDQTQPRGHTARTATGTRWDWQCDYGQSTARAAHDATAERGTESSNGTAYQPNAHQTPAAQNPVDDHAKLYKKLLLGLVPPTRYVDPQGNVQEVPQTKVSMGKTILASVLAGMFATPNVYRQTPYGSVIDASATTAAAQNAGASVVAKQKQTHRH